MKTTREKFVEIWQTSVDIQEASRRAKVRTFEAQQRAMRMMLKGIPLRNLPLHKGEPTITDLKVYAQSFLKDENRQTPS